MRDQDEGNPKQPRPISIGRKGDNAAEAQERGPSEVGPDRRHDGSDQHLHVRC